MSRIPLIVAVAISAPLLAAPSRSQAREDGPSAAVRRALKAQGPIVTEADHAAIRARCGVDVDMERRNNVTFSDGSLHCPDGRVFRDAETKALGERISARAHAHVKAAMSDPQVKAAIDRYAGDEARAALARVSDRYR